MQSNIFSEDIQVGAWRVAPLAGRIFGDGVERTLEPKVMDLLMLLASRPADVVLREDILAALWPDIVVGDDTLARCVSKLRKALGDHSKAPRYVETISKRGYRLIAPVGRPEARSAPPRRRSLVLAAAVAGMIAIMATITGFGVLRTPSSPDSSMMLIARAHDAYFQYTRADNETAIALYEQVLAREPGNAGASAGLARALVQRVIRWPNLPGEPDFTRTTLGAALADGRIDTPTARTLLDRAYSLATRAADLAPSDADVWQALGLTLAARRNFDTAEVSYRRALSIDADAWGALINLGDLNDIRGAPERALPLYVQAYEAMQRAYAREPQRIRPWQAEVGVLIAERYLAVHDIALSEAWYRRVLSQSPLHEGATAGLARLLLARGETAAAHKLCLSLQERTGASGRCGAIPLVDAPE